MDATADAGAALFRELLAKPTQLGRPPDATPAVAFTQWAQLMKLQEDAERLARFERERTSWNELRRFNYLMGGKRR